MSKVAGNYHLLKKALNLQKWCATDRCKSHQHLHLLGGGTMARPNVPTIPDNKKIYFREQLYRELSHMFEWKNLPSTIPHDYLERALVRHGYALYYYDDDIGQDVLRCEVTGYNRHNLPTHARTYTPNTTGERTQIVRRLRYLTEHENVESDFNPNTDGVLVCNMEYGQSASPIIEHFVERLALVQQAFDTNIAWANIPYIFQTSTDETRLSIEKMFSDIFEGKPFIIVDNNLFIDNKDRTGIPTGINFIGKELLDVHNEIMMKFRQTVGFDTAGVDKAERVNTLEIKSNTQHTKTVLQIMLEQRKKAAENINAFFGTNIEVTLTGQDEVDAQIEEVDDFGASNDRTEEVIDN